MHKISSMWQPCTYPNLVPPGKIKSTNFNLIDAHIKFTIELPGTDGPPFLDTLIKPTPNSIESTVYRKPIHTDRYLDYNS